MRRHLAATFKTHGLILSIRCLRLFHGTNVDFSDKWHRLVGVTGRAGIWPSGWFVVEVGAMPYGSPSRPPQLECRLISSCRIAYGR
ncbi:hypothetical protein ACN42_g7524 [Penicillium freii]|uniref:Uncharacterized protein n=1 Tax=Penicillium freii TaxID=48697 RepID=A0A101MFG7_PENFR|nr:hypothetical protein ACN42_g7524 [Penicillium freii]